MNDRELEEEVAATREQCRRAARELSRRAAAGGQGSAAGMSRVDFVELDPREELAEAVSSKPERVAELALPGGMVLRIFAPSRLC